MTIPSRLLDNLLGAPTSAARPTGLLTADDYAAARRQGLIGLGTGLLAASGGGNYQNLNQRLVEGVQGGRGAYQGALERASAQAMANQKYETGAFALSAAKQDQAREQQLMRAREQIISANPMPDGTDAGSLSQWIDRVLPSFIRIGDRETVGKLAEVRKSIEPKPRALQTTNLGDRTQWTDPTTGAVIREERNGQGPGTLRIATEMTPVQQERLWNTAVNQFSTQSKDFGKAREAWSQVDHVLQRARSGHNSPDDIVQLLDGISRLNNPGAVVRVGTVNLQLQKIGSFADKLRMMVGRGYKGAWPREIVEGIATAAREIAHEHEKQYSRLRAKAAARGEHIGLPAEYIEASLPNIWQDGVEGSAPAAAPVPALDQLFPVRNP